MNVFFQREDGIYLLNFLLSSYQHKTIVATCGPILRECLHHHSLLMYYLNHMGLLLSLFSIYPHSEDIDGRRDIFLTLQELLLGHSECGERRYAISVFFPFLAFIFSF